MLAQCRSWVIFDRFIWICLPVHFRFALKADFEAGLAIGDSVRTDLTGATGMGIDCLFVTAGIHAEELGDRHDPDPAAVNRIFADAGIAPKAVTRKLVW
jgi:ribonucleotide monophosphatase NagD (HAD superfamily)